MFGSSLTAFARHLSVIVSIASFAGCQELPPGVLAGSLPSSNTSVEVEVQDFVQSASRPNTMPIAQGERFRPFEPNDLAERLTLIERELAEVRSERDQLRMQLTATLEQVVESQSQLVEVYRRRAESAEADVRRMAASDPASIVQ